jgi:hypothetical protein
MGVDVAKDCQGLTVNAVTFLHGRGPVFYASLPCGPCVAETLKGCGTNGAGDKHRLVSSLWDHLVAMESPPLKRCQSSDRTAFPIQVVRGVLGRPHLQLGAYRGPAISFSEGGGNVWAALCALRLAGGDLEKAAALLWSIKEAVVKVLGCAFHLVDPRQITVYPSAGENGGYTFPVGLSGKALMRFPIGANRSIWVRSLAQGKMWLSIALLNRRPTDHE